MVKQTLIVAGGYGTRMSPANNKNRDKSLIEYAGQPMIAHLIDGLNEGGIERYVIASGYHNHDKLRMIVEQKGIDASVVPVKGGFRRVPYYLQDLLDDRFMLVCGHQPLPSDYVKKMLKSAETNECVITAYDNLTYPLNKKKRLVYVEKAQESELIAVDMEEENIDASHKYVRNPYVIGKKVVNLSKEEFFRWTFSHYIFEHWVNGGSLGVVEASMPPEFDYDEEFEKTKAFLDSLRI